MQKNSFRNLKIFCFFRKDVPQQKNTQKLSQPKKRWWGGALSFFFVRQPLLRCHVPMESGKQARNVVIPKKQFPKCCEKSIGVWCENLDNKGYRNEIGCGLDEFSKVVCDELRIITQSPVRLPPVWHNGACKKIAFEIWKYFVFFEKMFPNKKTHKN